MSRHTFRRMLVGLGYAAVYLLVGAIAHYAASPLANIGNLISYLFFGACMLYAVHEIVSHLEVNSVAGFLIALSAAFYFLYPRNQLSLADLQIAFSSYSPLGYVFLQQFYSPYSYLLSLARHLFFLIAAIFLWHSSVLRHRISALPLLTLILFLTIQFWKFAYIMATYDYVLYAGTAISVMTCDTSAYLAGRWLGHKVIKRRLTAISPAKSWEGAIVAFMLTTTAFTLLLHYRLFIVSWLAALLGLLLAFSAILGDLLFSALKRRLSISDYSNILPEHGGLNDRLDSSYSATIVMIIIIILLV